MRSMKILSALCALCVLTAAADELVLANGNRYKGTVSRNAKGQVEITTSKGTFAYDDEKVNFKNTKISEPSDFQDYQNALKKKDFAKIKTISAAWGKRYDGMPVRWNEMALYGKALVAMNEKRNDEAGKIFEEYGRLFEKGSYKGEIDAMNLTLKAGDMSRDELKKTYAGVLAGKPGTEAAAARMHLELGKLQLEDGEAAEALENFASVVVLYGDIPDLEQEALFGCGEAYLALKEADKAAFYFRQLAEGENESFKERAAARLKELK